MTWHTIANGNVMDNSDFNDNMDHVFSGSRLPLDSAGTAFGSTDSAFDLGSDSFRHRTLYCDNLQVDSSYTTDDKKLWILETKTELTDTASSIEFTGLNGDGAIEYVAIGYGIENTATNFVLNVIFNGDSAANYGSQELRGQGAGASAARNTARSSLNFMWSAATTTTNKLFSYMHMFLKTGSERNTLNLFMGGETTYVWRIASESGIWKNTADTITSIKFYDSSGNGLATGTTIYLFKRA